VRFEHLIIKNIGPFKDVRLDLSALEGKLIAVTGANGAGKSTLLELLPGALYRECPTRGALTALATGRDAMLEVRAANGRAYTIRQTADCISKKSEALILNADGAPQLDSAKVRDADAWVAAHFPSSEVLYSSSFLSQSSAGFTELPAADRKRVLLRLLRIERLELLAERARDNARASKTQFETACARLEQTKALTPDLAECEAAHAHATECVAEAEADVAATFKALQDAQQAQRDAAAHDGKRARRQQLLRAISEAGDQAADVTLRIANNRGLIAQRTDIEAAVQKRDRADKSIQTLTSQLNEARLAHSAAESELARATHELQSAEQRIKRAEYDASTARDVLEARGTVEAAIEALPKAKAAAKAAQTAVDAAEQACLATEALLRTQKDDRIKGLRTGLTAVAQKPASAKTLARDALAADDQLKDAADGAPKALTAARAKLKKLRDAQSAATERVAELQEAAAGASELARADKHLAAALRDGKAAAAEVAAATKAVSAARAKRKKAADEQQQLTKRVDALRSERIEANAQASLLPKLEAAQARLEELEPQLARLTAQRELDEAELAAMPELPVTLVDVAAAQRANEAATKHDRSMRAELAQCTERLKSARAGAETLSALAAQRSALDAELANWTRLGLDLGKDGLQALEIDAAIPQLNTLTNDLLHSCHGARFTVELRSSRVSADGKRMLEDLDISVLDTVMGREAAVEIFSGGERVVISEAVSLALTMLACQRAGLSRPTLVRDESGAALDPGNGRAYIAMLRRAAELVDADKVLFVTHNPELQELADVRIEVADGSARVVLT